MAGPFAGFNSLAFLAELAVNELEQGEELGEHENKEDEEDEGGEEAGEGEGEGEEKAATVSTGRNMLRRKKPRDNDEVARRPPLPPPRRSKHDRRGRSKHPVPQSLYFGVHWERRESKWRAEHTVDGVKNRLGLYDDDHEAFQAIMRFKEQSRKKKSGGKAAAALAAVAAVEVAKKAPINDKGMPPLPQVHLVTTDLPRAQPQPQPQPRPRPPPPTRAPP